MAFVGSFVVFGNILQSILSVNVLDNVAELKAHYSIHTSACARRH
jgi:hypothetical protein